MDGISAAEARVDHLLVGLDCVDEPVLVLGEFKKVVGLGHFSNFTKDLRPLAVYFFLFSNELLLAHTVIAVIVGLVYLALIKKLLKDLLDYIFMSILRGTDVVVVGNV